MDAMRQRPSPRFALSLVVPILLSMSTRSPGSSSTVGILADSATAGAALAGPLVSGSFLAALAAVPGFATLASRELEAAVRERNVTAFIEAFTKIAASSPKQLSSALELFGKLGDELSTARDWAGIRALHQSALDVLRRSEGKDLPRTLESSRRKLKHWRARGLLLDFAAVSPGVDVEKAALEGLTDKHPAVVRLALSYLAKTKKPQIVESIVGRFVEIEKAANAKNRAAPDWSRALGTFHAALESMFHIELPAAVDWANFIKTRKGSPDFFAPAVRSSSESRTGLSLFGTAVRGKNIIFVLDISGSMTSTDPRPETDAEKSRGTIVGEAEAKRLREAEMKERVRMTRAKKELTRVIESLPSDVRFNIVAYSSEVRAWQSRLIDASAESRSKAKDFIAELEPEGVTVTDIAIAEAFGDIEVDTIFLITDGVPTHIGNNPGDAESSLPTDSRELMESIHGLVSELNFLRGVRIECLGFRGAPTEFLEKLAKDNAGGFRAIP
jgi:hypothetical protein